MRTVPLCNTVFQVPRNKVYSWVNAWWNGFDSVRGVCKESRNFRLLSMTVFEQGGNKRWSRRSSTTSGEGRSKNVLSSATNIRHGIPDQIVETITKNLKIEKKDYRQLVAENKEVAELATFIVFDLETTGFSSTYESIIEIALLDIQGGEKSTFHTLVNPGRLVPKISTEITKITTEMVNHPSVPRMEELIPILLQFIKSRQKPGGFVVLVAHNAKTFDVPFLVNAFARCNTVLPSNWLFLDTLPLAREQMKLKEMKIKTGLESLRDYYGIKLEGDAHRAMSDVYTLTKVFKGLSFGMKLSRADLIQRSFTINELNSAKKKKKDS